MAEHPKGAQELAPLTATNSDNRSEKDEIPSLKGAPPAHLNLSSIASDTTAILIAPSKDKSLQLPGLTVTADASVAPAAPIKSALSKAVETKPQSVNKQGDQLAIFAGLDNITAAIVEQDGTNSPLLRAIAVPHGETVPVIATPLGILTAPVTAKDNLTPPVKANGKLETVPSIAQLVVPPASGDPLAIFKGYNTVIASIAQSEGAAASPILHAGAVLISTSAVAVRETAGTSANLATVDALVSTIAANDVLTNSAVIQDTRALSASPLVQSTPEAGTPKPKGDSPLRLPLVAASETTPAVIATDPLAAFKNLQQVTSFVVANDVLVPSITTQTAFTAETPVANPLHVSPSAAANDIVNGSTTNALPNDPTWIFKDIDNQAVALSKADKSLQPAALVSATAAEEITTASTSPLKIHDTVAAAILESAPAGLPTLLALNTPNASTETVSTTTKVGKTPETSKDEITPLPSLPGVPATPDPMAIFNGINNVAQSIAANEAGALVQSTPEAGTPKPKGDPPLRLPLVAASETTPAVLTNDPLAAFKNLEQVTSFVAANDVLVPSITTQTAFAAETPVAALVPGSPPAAATDMVTGSTTNALPNDPNWFFKDIDNQAVALSKADKSLQPAALVSATAAEEITTASASPLKIHDTVAAAILESAPAGLPTLLALNTPNALTETVSTTRKVRKTPEISKDEITPLPSLPGVPATPDPMAIFNGINNVAQTIAANDAGTKADPKDGSIIAPTTAVISREITPNINLTTVDTVVAAIASSDISTSNKLGKKATDGGSPLNVPVDPLAKTADGASPLIAPVVAPIDNTPTVLAKDPLAAFKDLEQVASYLTTKNTSTPSIVEQTVFTTESLAKTRKSGDTTVGSSSGESPTLEPTDVVKDPTLIFKSVEVVATKFAQIDQTLQGTTAPTPIVPGDAGDKVAALPNTSSGDPLWGFNDIDRQNNAMAKHDFSLKPDTSTPIPDGPSKPIDNVLHGIDSYAAASVRPADFLSSPEVNPPAPTPSVFAVQENVATSLLTNDLGSPTIIVPTSVRIEADATGSSIYAIDKTVTAINQTELGSGDQVLQPVALTQDAAPSPLEVAMASVAGYNKAVAAIVQSDSISGAPLVQSALLQTAADTPKSNDSEVVRSTLDKIVAIIDGKGAASLLLPTSEKAQPNQPIDTIQPVVSQRPDTVTPNRGTLQQPDSTSLVLAKLEAAPIKTDPPILNNLSTDQRINHGTTTGANLPERTMQVAAAGSSYSMDSAPPIIANSRRQYNAESARDSVNIERLPSLGSASDMNDGTNFVNSFRHLLAKGEAQATSQSLQDRQFIGSPIVSLTLTGLNTYGVAAVKFDHLQNANFDNALSRNVIDSRLLGLVLPSSDMARVSLIISVASTAVGRDGAIPIPAIPLVPISGLVALTAAQLPELKIQPISLTVDGRIFVTVVGITTSSSGDKVTASDLRTTKEPNKFEDDETGKKPDSESEESASSVMVLRPPKLRGDKDEDNEDDSEEIVPIATIGGGTGLIGGSSQTDPDPTKSPTGQDPQPSQDPSQVPTSLLIQQLPGLEIFDESLLIASSETNVPPTQPSAPVVPTEVEDPCISNLRQEDSGFSPAVIADTSVLNPSEIVEHIVSATTFDMQPQHGISIGQTHFDDTTLSGMSSENVANSPPPKHFDDEGLSNYYGHRGHRDGEINEIIRTFGARKTRDNDSISDDQPGILDALKFDRWHSYKVKKGDTLLSIAARELGNPRLVPLLIQLNRGQLVFDKQGNVKLKPGTTLRMPSRAEVIRYLAQSEQQQAPIVCFAQDPNEVQLPYVCRLGDTLRNIAKRHPAMRDARLWPLIAKVNGIAISEPIAQVKRGQKIILPSLEERKTFLLEWEFGEDPRVSEERRSRKRTLDSANDRSAASNAHATNSWNSASGTVRAAAAEEAVTVVSRDNDTVRTTNTAVFENQDETLVTAAAGLVDAYHSRVITQPDLGEGSDALDLKLEIYTSGCWSTVVAYTIRGANDSCVTIYTGGGRKHQISIELPSRAARELAENDLSANGTVYCTNYLRDRLPF